MLHMLIGRTKTRDFLQSLQHDPEKTKVDTAPIGIPFDLLRRMLGQADERPDPKEILRVLQAAPRPQAMGQKMQQSSKDQGRARGSRSRSRTRDGKKLPAKEQAHKVFAVATSTAQSSERPTGSKGSSDSMVFMMEW